MPSQQSPWLPRCSRRLNFAFGMVAAGIFLTTGLARAQVIISSIVTTANTSAGSTTESGTNPTTITYQNDVNAITSFNAGGNNYTIQSTATNAYVRRNTTAGNFNGANIWEQNAVAANTVVGSNPGNLATMLLGNNLNQGAINLFSNGNTATSWQTNIERVDFVWSGGINVQATDGFAVFDMNGTQEGFQVALITSLGTGLGTPSSWTFTNALEVAPGSYGAALDVNNDGSADATNFRVLRYANGDAMTTHADAGSSYTQSLDGTFIRMSDLGIASGTTIYGYAIMATDVTNSGALLANWNNTTNYSTTTDNIVGGLDLAAFNGQLGRIVPEPATYGVILLGTATGLIALRRKKITADIAA